MEAVTAGELSSEQVLALFAKLEPLLESDDTDSMNLVDELRFIPGAQELARQIENFDFKPAAGTLVNLRIELKKKWESNNI